MDLNEEQVIALGIATNAHNIFITGQAGTGKSTIVSCIVANLWTQNKNVSVVCASGISCTVYCAGNTSTVHDNVMERSTVNSIVIERLHEQFTSSIV